MTNRRRLAADARTVQESVRAIERWLDDAFDLVDIVQIREPDLDAGVLAGLVRRVAARARGSRTTIVVNDRADVALAADAGVHLKAGGPPTARVRALGSADWMVGRSVHSVDEVRREDAVSYLLFGTVFATASKGPDTPLQGLEGLERAAIAANDARVPLLAIGGMTPERAGQCVKAGAAGVAAIGAFLQPGQDPAAMGLEAAAMAFREAMIG